MNIRCQPIRGPAYHPSMRLNIRTVLSCCLVFTASAPLHSQVVYDTVEALANRAEAVYVGRVVTVAAAPGFPADSQQRSVVIAIEQTLKGKPVQQLSFEDADSRMMQWQKSGARLLLAIGRGEGPPMRAIDLTDIGLWGMSENLVVLQTPEQLLQAVRVAVQRTPQATRKETSLSLPPCVPTGSHWPQGEPVIFPVDEHLERLAHTILSKEAGDGYRVQAVQALQFFKSDENIRLLTSLLSHPSDVRTCEEANRVLTGWGVSSPKPAN